MSSKLDAVVDVDIESGRFKYILIKVMESSSLHKHIVRGYKRAGYHADILDEILPGIESLGLKADCVGGGRIEHDKDKKTILVYGYSMGFGRADHAVTTEILKRFFPSYNTITFSNEGY